MMGRTHILSGTTAWAGAAAASTGLGLHPRPAVIAAGMLTAAGAALLPDLDHPDATIAHCFGPASKAAATAVHRLAGGHRQATHSIAFTAGCLAATWLGVAAAGALFVAPLLFVLFTFAVRPLRIRRVPSAVLGAVATALTVPALAGDYGWIPAAVALGVAAHLAGDCLTPEGCPLAWPHRTRYRLPVIAHTNNRLERYLFAPGFAIATIALLTAFR